MTNTVYVKGLTGPKGAPGSDGAPGLDGVDGSEAVVLLQEQLDALKLKTAGYHILPILPDKLPEIEGRWYGYIEGLYPDKHIDNKLFYDFTITKKSTLNEIVFGNYKQYITLPDNSAGNLTGLFMVYKNNNKWNLLLVDTDDHTTFDLSFSEDDNKKLSLSGPAREVTANNETLVAYLTLNK